MKYIFSTIKPWFRENEDDDSLLIHVNNCHHPNRNGVMLHNVDLEDFISVEFHSYKIFLKPRFHLFILQKAYRFSKKQSSLLVLMSKLRPTSTF